MRIAVKTVGNRVYYLNFDLIVEFNFDVRDDDSISFVYSSKIEDDCFDRIIITEEEKNRILNKLDLL